MTKAKVVLTRRENELKDLQSKYPGIEWIDFPLIHFEYQKLEAKVLDQVQEDFDWLIFTSQNGVQSFIEQSGRGVKKNKIACVGPKTAATAEASGLRVEFIPSLATSLTLARELPSTSQESICYIGGNLSSSETILALKEKASSFKQIEVYQTLPKTHRKSEWENLLAQNPGIISFCSPSAVKSYKDQVAHHGLTIPTTTEYASIGSTTYAAVEEHLGSLSIIGNKYTFEAMIQAIVSNL